MASMKRCFGLRSPTKRVAARDWDSGWGGMQPWNKSEGVTLAPQTIRRTGLVGDTYLYIGLPLDRTREHIVSVCKGFRELQILPLFSGEKSAW
jgi:hypothetical protein